MNMSRDLTMRPSIFTLMKSGSSIDTTGNPLLLFISMLRYGTMNQEWFRWKVIHLYFFPE